MIIASGPKVIPTSSLSLAARGRITDVDAIDRKLLALLQDDGRLSLTDLASKVGLSISPCHRRVRELERSGAITSYRAVINPAALGLTFEALVFVTMRQEDRDTLQAFEAGLAAIPHVLSAERLFGDPDYLLRILATDLAAYHALQDEQLGVLPGVQRMTSTLVMKRVVADRSIPT